MPTSAITVLEQEVHDLGDEEQAILTTADAAAARGESPSSEQMERLGAIQERLPEAEGQLTQLRAARERRREEPSLPAGASEAAGASLGQAGPSASPTPFATFGDQMMAIHGAAYAKINGAPVDPRLQVIQAATGASTLVGADGGFAVQTDFDARIREQVWSASVLADRCSVQEIGPEFNSVTWNESDERTLADGTISGGIQAYFVAEGGTITPSRPKLRQRKVSLAKAVGMYVPTAELLQDGVAFQSHVERNFPKAIAWILDRHIFAGPGAGVPKGILGHSATISVAKETGQGAATFIAENVEKMYARLDPDSIGSSAWFINQGVWPQIFALNKAIGTGGVPLFIPAGGLVNTPSGTLMGRPIIPIKQAEALGTKGDVTLGDFSQYLLVRKGGIRQDSSIHVYFSTDELAFRWILRVNGEPLVERLVTPFKGAVTVSPFVTLDTRA